jgi:ankyrin repeat domain-containing protein 50
MDFARWSSAHCPQVLWLSGPLECNIRQVSLHIVQQEKKTALKTDYFVLYLFSSTPIGRSSTVTDFVHPLLNQIVYCSPLDKRIFIVRNFLHSLFDEFSKNKANPNWKKLIFKNVDFPDPSIQEFLNAPANELLTALEAALGDEEQRGLSVVMDGLDKVEYQRGEFIRGVRAFVEHLQQRTSNVKTLLTSQPVAEIKDLLDGLLCIEHNRERKGPSVTYVLTLD